MAMNLSDADANGTDGRMSDALKRPARSAPKRRPAVDVFAIPVQKQFLIYAPLHDLAALVDTKAVEQLRDGLRDARDVGEGRLNDLLRDLRTRVAPTPQPRRGDLTPAFLGLLPTRGCNLSCRYCGFLSAGDSNELMDLSLARDAVEWYVDLVGKSGLRHAEVHYFGGEPFCAEEVLDLTVHLARIRAEETRCAVRFEVATNGVFSEERCRWAADSLDTIVLSMDGPADIHDLHRSFLDGRGSFEVVTRTARILSGGAADFFVRACVTAETVDRMPEIAAWICQNYRPRGVCFEPVQPTSRGGVGQLVPPDPWRFACNFIRAARVLEAHGMEAIYSAADIGARRVSFCPVGQDVAIVSPDGVISACYLLQRDWEAKGLNLRLGRVGDGGTVELDEKAVAFARSMNVWNKSFCARCFCKWHCAGGCHVNHVLPDSAGDYDRLCLQTRIITIRNILKAAGREDITNELLADPQALERAVLQPSDTLIDVGERL